MELFKKDYDGESLYDLPRDVIESLDARFNPTVADIPRDEHGFQQGTFRVVVTWEPESAGEP